MAVTDRIKNAGRGLVLAVAGASATIQGCATSGTGSAAESVVYGIVGDLVDGSTPGGKVVKGGLYAGAAAAGHNARRDIANRQGTHVYVNSGNSQTTDQGLDYITYRRDRDQKLFIIYGQIEGVTSKVVRIRSTKGRLHTIGRDAIEDYVNN